MDGFTNARLRERGPEPTQHEPTPNLSSRSYVSMCSSGCRLPSSRMNNWLPRKCSIEYLAVFYVPMADDCRRSRVEQFSDTYQIKFVSEFLWCYYD
jgi:hypothetical protein